MMALPVSTKAPLVLLKNKVSAKVTSLPVTPSTKSELAGSVTEIVVQNNNFSNIPMLMPLLAQLSQDDRWFVWIAPPVLLPKQLLADAGIDLNKVILLNPDNKHSTFALAKQALSTGTSHSVISWPGYLSERELNELENAAKQGQSHGIVIRRRQHS
ncbi:MULTISPECIES: cell division inhibitor SulA [unclassified Neptuniibacter]|jgi:cell division inhibitor SulA|uniref:cell division inhibitor SulA n=1 Tax=unclassified Neptuniibacter TaxID=2630693 RepID=UPI0026E19DC4|nr:MULTISPECIES: SulA-like leucine-rich domain-containing protein [unclassified Neptuniibacter]MDO6513180.1 SulA-like leucine-rich domain-containing protein [Neptuniibacter sp. 2_MG-2023]MDO6592408.1 SulA-like leucine-rich domain-containing protein [Neptuniibacter sp. 1_MG-2023]